MTVILTGASGFLGKYVQDELVNRGILTFDYSSSVHGDLTHESNFDNFLNRVGKQYKIDGVIHLAACVGGIGVNSYSGYSFMLDNLKMGINVINSSVEHDVGHFVMASTVCAYPEHTAVPFKEEDLWYGKPEPTNAGYGVAKRTLGELLYQANHQFNFKSVTLNLANLYGVGQDDNPSSSHVIPAIFKKIADYKNGLSESVALWGDGTASRDFLHVKDAARAIVDAYIYNNQGPIDGINIGTGVETTISNLVVQITRKMGIYTDSVEFVGGALNGQRRRCLNIDRARRILDWKPTIALNEGLDELSNHYLSASS